MDIIKNKWKINLLNEAWRRCRSLGSGNFKSPKNLSNSLTRSKTWHCTASSSEDDRVNMRKNKSQVAPDGCFSVYVGPEKQRFAIKAELANHPLFKILLEDAELEYGFNSDGPILLPCDVDLFYKILAEMETVDEIISPSWSLLIPCSPARRSANKGYRLLSPSRLLKLNQI